MERASIPSADARFIKDLLQALVRIPSANPALVPGGDGEGPIARYLAGVCGELGLRVTVEEVAPGRPNVVAVLPGVDPKDGRSLLLNGHMDTVGTTGMRAPFAAEVREGRLYGRGSYDMKGGLAAMVGAAAALRRAGVEPRGDVILAFVADEEHLSLGTAAVVAGLRADGAIVTEPTELAIGVAHKGFLWAAIQTRGRAAHGSDYETGVDAIAHMGRVLGALERLDREVLSRRSHPLLGRPSLHASVIEGGEGLSTYPPSCSLAIERRMLPAETEAQARAELEEVLAALHRDDPRVTASLEITGSRPGLEVDPAAEVVRALHRACEQRRGTPPAHVGLAPWYDAALLARAGMPTVIFGPSGRGAHAEVEYVELASVAACADILAATAAGFCGAGERPPRRG